MGTLDMHIQGTYLDSDSHYLRNTLNIIYRTQLITFIICYTFF